jgi:hypothetical protein
MSFIDSVRAAADNGYGVIALKELSAYNIYLTTVSNDVVSFDSNKSSRARSDVRITVGAGVGQNLNPHIQYLTKADTNGVSVLSGGSLTDMEILLGPLALPYNTGYQVGGFDASNFQPTNQSAHTSIYVHITGFGMNVSNGNYFTVKEIVLNGMDNIFYYVRLKSTSNVIP